VPLKTRPHAFPNWHHLGREPGRSAPWREEMEAASTLLVVYSNPVATIPQKLSLFLGILGQRWIAHEAITR
jgi:hypothetical protein